GPKRFRELKAAVDQVGNYGDGSGILVMIAAAAAHQPRGIVLKLFSAGKWTDRPGRQRGAMGQKDFSQK
ncbi:hypothetical protein ACHAXS_006248, partial [Conticribra weissflogii]